MLRAIVAALAIALAPAASHAASPPELVGDWKGAMGSGARTLTLIFHIGEDRVVADSPEQGAYALPARVESAAGAITLAIPLVGVSFNGRLSADNQRLEGLFYQGSGWLPLTLTRTSKVATLPPPPKPAPPEIRGEWEGALKTGGGLVTILYHLTDRPSADIAAQNVTGLPVEVEKIGEIWKVTVLDAVFAGKLAADGKSIVGAMRQGEQTGQMTLIRK